MKTATLCCRLLLMGLMVVALGCSDGGPTTVPAKGTLTIDGQPANDVTITLVPSGGQGQEAAGPVKGGNFELFSGVQGKAGAVPGKYKVVLSAVAGMGPEVTEQYNRGAGRAGKSGSPELAVKLPFPEKYKTAATSDKEVEITSGPNELKIEITSGPAS